jgi:transcriptional regulator with XRE-family HTH domain
MNEKEEVERLLNVLRVVVRLLGLSNREIERRLGLTPSYVSRLFAGAIELKVEHILSIVRAVGLEPWEFYELAYPRRADAPSEAYRSIHSLLGGLQAPLQELPSPSQGGSKMTRREIDEMIQESVRQAFNELAAKRK